MPEAFTFLLTDEQQLCQSVQYDQWPGVLVLRTLWLRKILEDKSSFLQAAYHLLDKGLQSL